MQISVLMRKKKNLFSKGSIGGCCREESTIELDSSSEKNDNQFFEIIDTTVDSVVFAFKSPPDFENPVDLGSDTTTRFHLQPIVAEHVLRILRFE